MAIELAVMVVEFIFQLLGIALVMAWYRKRASGWKSALQCSAALFAVNIAICTVEIVAEPALRARWDATSDEAGLKLLMWLAWLQIVIAIVSSLLGTLAFCLSTYKALAAQPGAERDRALLVAGLLPALLAYLPFVILVSRMADEIRAFPQAFHWAAPFMAAHYQWSAALPLGVVILWLARYRKAAALAGLAGGLAGAGFMSVAAIWSLFDLSPLGYIVL